MDYYIIKGINVSCRTINGKAFILDQNTRLLIKLDEIGSFIWDQIKGVKTVKQISEICYHTFLGEKEHIESSVQEFINDLHNRKLVVLSEEPFKEEFISVC